MTISDMLLQLALVAVQGVVLFLLSRGLFIWVLQSLAGRSSRRFGHKLLQLIRLPGNIVHETSHALAFLVGGFRVRRLVFCLVDPQGAGVCRPGKPWSPHAIPWLATGLAALAPLLVGALLLWLAAGFLDIPLNGHLSPQSPARSLLDGFYSSLLAIDFSAWQTWLFLYLAFTVGAELAPSPRDLQLGLPALLLVTLFCGAVLFGVYQLDPTSPLRVALLQYTAHGLSWLSRLFGFAIVTTGIVAALTFLPATLIRSARG
jgi:hypothetical protein